MFGRSVAGLMANFSYRAKFIIIAAIFAIPLLIMAFWLVSIAHRDIQDIKQQRVGYEILVQQFKLAEIADELYALRLAVDVPGASESAHFQTAVPAEVLTDSLKRMVDELANYAPAVSLEWSLPQDIREFQRQLVETKRFVSVGYGLSSSGEAAVPLMVATLSQYLPEVRTLLIGLHFQGVSLLSGSTMSVDHRLAYRRSHRDLLKALADLSQLHRASSKLFVDDEYGAALQQMIALLKGFLAEHEQNKLSKKAESNPVESWDQHIETIMTQINRLDTMSHALLLSQLKERERIDYLVYVSIVALIILVGLLSSVVFLSFYRATVKTITDLQRAARLLSEGDLNARVLVSGSDEMASVSQCFNQMAEEFSQVLLEVIRKMNRVESNTLKMKASSSVTSMNVQEQHHKVDQVTDSVNRLTDSYQVITDMTQRTAEFSNTARESTLSNVNQIRDSIERLSKMADDFHATTQSLSVLEAESNRISAVLASIREIADQTNLLALNAANEAARAGEMGRGFAVVSDEVRALAVKTQTATESVAETIDALQRSIETFIESTQNSYTNMKSGIDDASGASDLIAEVSGQIQQIYEMSEQIASQTQQNSAATLGVRDTMTEIRAISESAHAAVIMNAESSGNLAQLTQKLKTVLGHFSAESSDDVELF